MVTVSELCWIETDKNSICKSCNRTVPVGHLNLIGEENDIRCIDCFFGPPIEHWAVCKECGFCNPGRKCEKCGSEDMYCLGSVLPDDE